MDVVVWEAWRKARGRKKAELAKWMLDDDQRLIHGCVRACLPKRVGGEDLWKTFYMDAFQAACVGYLTALSRWKPEQGSFDGTFWCWGRHEIQQLRLRSAAIRVPRGGADLTAAKKREIEAFYAQNGRDPEPEEVEISQAAIAKAARAAMTFCPIDESRDAAEFQDTGELIDQKRDATYLNSYLKSLPAKDREGLLAGRRPDLEEKAKSYVEKRRETRIVSGGARKAVQPPRGHRKARESGRRVA